MFSVEFDEGSPPPVDRVHGSIMFYSLLQIQYEITRVRQKMKDLALLHDKHMNRPTLDDSTEEEHAIEITTQEITQVGPASEFKSTTPDTMY